MSLPEALADLASAASLFLGKILARASLVEATVRPTSLELHPQVLRFIHCWKVRFLSSGFAALPGEVLNLLAAMIVAPAVATRVTPKTSVVVLAH